MLVDEVKQKFYWSSCFEPKNHLNTLEEKVINLTSISISCA